MKKLLILLFFVLFASFNAHAKARIPVCFPCEAIDIVEELPNEDALKQEGRYLDLGYLHEEYSILFISFWNTEGKYVLSSEDKTTYYDLSEEQLKELETKYSFDTSGNPLGLWKKMGGKMILVILIGIGIFSAVSKSDDDEAKESK